MDLHLPEGTPKTGGLRSKVSLDGKEKGRLGTIRLSYKTEKDLMGGWIDSIIDSLNKYYYCSSYVLAHGEKHVQRPTYPLTTSL